MLHQIPLWAYTEILWSKGKCIRYPDSPAGLWKRCETAPVSQWDFQPEEQRSLLEWKSQLQDFVSLASAQVYFVWKWHGVVGLILSHSESGSHSCLQCTHKWRDGKTNVLFPRIERQRWFPLNIFVRINTATCRIHRNNCNQQAYV